MGVDVATGRAWRKVDAKLCKNGKEVMNPKLALALQDKVDEAKQRAQRIGRSAAEICC